jgi:hypothetical protein
MIATVTLDDNTEMAVASAEDLRAVLAELRERKEDCRFPTVYLEDGDAQLIVGLSRQRDRGMLYWSASPDDAPQVPATGDSSNTEAYGRNEIAMPPYTEIPVAQVLDAAEQFAATGQRPTCVTWISDDSAWTKAGPAGQTI